MPENVYKWIIFLPVYIVIGTKTAQFLHLFYLISMFYKIEIWNSHFKNEAMCSWLIMFCKNRTMCRSLYPDCKHNAFRNCCCCFHTRINTPELPPCKHPDHRSCCLKHYGHCVLQVCKTDIFMLVATSWKQDTVYGLFTKQFCETALKKSPPLGCLCWWQCKHGERLCQHDGTIGGIYYNSAV